MSSHWTYPARIGITARELRKLMKSLPPLTEHEKAMLEQRMIADAEARTMRGRFRALNAEMVELGEAVIAALPKWLKKRLW